MVIHSEDYQYFYLSKKSIDDVVSGESIYKFNDNIARSYHISNCYSDYETYVFSMLLIYDDKRIEPSHKDDPDSYYHLDSSIKTSIVVWLPLSYVEDFYNSTASKKASDLAHTLSMLKLSSKQISVSDASAMYTSEKMMSDFIATFQKGETYYPLGRCDSIDGGFLQNGYAFVTEVPVDFSSENYFYYAIPSKCSLYLCYVDSEIYICWKDNLPINSEKATVFITEILNDDIQLEDINSDGYYLFWYNLLYNLYGEAELLLF